MPLAKIIAMNQLSALNNETALNEMAAGAPSPLKINTTWHLDRPLYLGLIENLTTTIPPELFKYTCRSSIIILNCLEPLKDLIANLTEKVGPDRIAVIVGTSASGVDSGIKVVKAKLNAQSRPVEYDYSQIEVGGVSALIGAALGLTGINYTISTACSSSAKAFASALKILDLGLADYVVTGGSEAMSQMTVEGFSSLGLLSQKLCNPFGESRDGINIGEGAAFFILERAAQFEKNNLYLLGAGEANDAYHISSPDPQGAGAIAAINTALKNAALPASAINYINLHGTGTLANDLMESKAVNQIFSIKTYCSSTKSYTGHTLGASSAIEAWICLQILDQLIKTGATTLPQNLLSGEYGSDLFDLNLVRSRIILTENRINLLSNSFGFGGSNCALIFGAEFEKGGG